jgi:hypothetical protein
MNASRTWPHAAPIFIQAEMASLNVDNERACLLAVVKGYKALGGGLETDG